MSGKGNIDEGYDKGFQDGFDVGKAPLTRLRAQQTVLVDALKDVPIFQSNGFTKTCIGCGALHWFSDGPPVVIKHKPECWGGAILAALATLDVPDPKEG